MPIASNLVELTQWSSSISALPPVKNPAPRIHQQAGQNQSIGNQESTPPDKEAGCPLPGSDKQGSCPPHCASRAGAADSLTAFRVLLFGSAIRCEWGRHSLSQRTARGSWLDWTNGAHHQPLVNERRLASVCALFVWPRVTRVDTTDPRGRKRGSPPRAGFAVAVAALNGSQIAGGRGPRLVVVNTVRYSGLVEAIHDRVLPL
jgi:hypothetical protein